MSTDYLGNTMRGPHNGKGGFVYLMSNAANTVLYTGITADLHLRVWNHKAGRGGAFTSAYHCAKLLYYEQSETIEAAIARESQLKNWKRAWKLDLVRKENPGYDDLAADWYTGNSPEAVRTAG